MTTGQGTTLRWELSGATSASISPVPGPIASSGSIAISPNSTTTYSLTATNEAGIATASVKVGVDVTLLPPRINEFMADNSETLKDEDGDYSDWIEIANPNEFGLELNDYFLTDLSSNSLLWQFPQVKIPRNGFLVLFASGKNRRATPGELHTSFRLSEGGEYFALTYSNRTIVQQFSTYPSQTKDASYGLGSNSVTGFFRAPTPGASNEFAFAGIIADLKFGRERGFYDNGFPLAISCETPGVTIRYTTNRSAPTATTGFIFSSANPIPITNTTIIRAAAFRNGWSPTETVTHTYLFLSNVIAAPNMNTSITRSSVYGPQMRQSLLDVPTLSVTTTETINGGGEVKTALEWLNPSGAPGFQVDCGIRHFGGAFTDFAKKNFRLYFRGSWGAPKLRYPVFAGFDRGLAAVEEFDQLELRGGSHDMEMRGFYMSNIFTDDTLLEMGRLNPHGRFVHLYMNGTYWGIYHLRERWGAAMHRSYLGGTSDDYESINGNWNVGGWAEPGSPYDGDGSVWERIKQNRTNYIAVKPWLDVPEYVDYMLMWMFGGAETEYRAAGPNVPGSGFKFYLNDADGWFCGPYYCDAGNNTVAGAPGRQVGDGPGSIFSMLAREGHPDYRTLLADRIQKNMFNSGALTVERNKARLIERCKEIERAFFAESARWNQLTPTEWAARRDYALNNWLPQRTTEAFNQYKNAGLYPTLAAPTFTRQTNVIFFTGPAANIYYTTNGSDPRLPGGAISSDAKVFIAGGPTEKLIIAGARWRWFTDATGLGSSAIVAGAAGWSETNWKHPAFADQTWSEAPAQFGYGESDEATTIPYGPDANRKWVSSYYRCGFTVNDRASITNLLIRLKRDDGAIIYINGREAGRSSITSGAVSATTLANPAPDDGQNFNDIPIAVTNLVEGQNIIAVEVHQATLNSSDLSFDLELIASRAVTPPSSSGIGIARNTLLKARAKEGNTWSALTESLIQLTPATVTSNHLAISELHFLPANRDGSEFLELENISDEAIDLRGVRFTQGINFQFPTNRSEFLAPGQRLVLVKDLFRFQRHYGIDIPVAGIYSGGLSSSGEQLTLTDGSQSIIASIRYQLAQPWPVSTGFSLILSDPFAFLNDPHAWRASASPGGTPGWTDETFFQGDPFADNDADRAPAFLEYALGASDSNPADALALTPTFDQFGNFTLNFTRNLRAADASISAEFSEDLETWFPGIPTATVNLANGLALESWAASSANRPILFARLKAEQR